MKPATPAPHWHAEDTAQVMQHWQSSDDGLSQHAAAERLQRYGRNSLPQPAAPAAAPATPAAGPLTAAAGIIA